MAAFGRQLIRKIGGGKWIVKRVVAVIPFKTHVATIAVIGGIFTWMYGFKVAKNYLKGLLSTDTYVYHQEMDDFLYNKALVEHKTNAQQF
uniref:Uncharacterized protein n=1 Tax=Globodera rostochiensis TaxID=31243 RepID=A0A914I7Z2_GLORO